MILSGLTLEGVGRSVSPLCLCELLEIRLRIDVETLVEDTRESRVDMCQDEVFRILETEIEIEGSDHCLECIRQDIGIILSLCEELAPRELNNI